MKCTIVTAILVLGMSLGFSPHASAQQPKVLVTVPFDFAVGGRTLPQGSYEIVSDHAFIAFRNADQKITMYIAGQHGQTAKDGRTVLVFDDVKGDYFLRKIVTVSDAMSMEFPLSKLESQTRNSESARTVYGETSGR
jgi:hypothetical protein